MKYSLLFFIVFFSLNKVVAQYVFPDCYSPYESRVYTGGEKASLSGINYTASNWLNTPPPGTGWTSDGPCGNPDDALGPKYAGDKKIIGYMPTWQSEYDFDKYDPSKLTHVIVSFLEFKGIDVGVTHDNMDYTSNDFVSSIAFNEKSVQSVDSILTHSTTNLLQKSRDADIKVLVAVGGAIDYGFLWLMNKYYNNDTKITEIAQLMVDYVNSSNIDGVDLDMECWWADPTINKITDQGGRSRGNKWGGLDSGPENAAIGITRLAKKIKELSPGIIVSTVVFGTGWYGNNYDEQMADYVDWIGIFTYDFTGSWDATPFGPHGALYKLPLDSYEKQTLDNPIYSTEEVCEFWVGIAEPAWNHDGGFDIERNKLCIGAPFYGYDFSTHKPNGGNGYEFEKYADIVAKYPNAPTSYDSNTPGQFNGNINENGENIFYETPLRAKAKVDFIYDYGQQGIIMWELTNDLPSDNENSLLKSIHDQKQKRSGTLSDENLTNNKYNNTLKVSYSNGTINYWYSKTTTEPSLHNNSISIYDIIGREITSFKTNTSRGEYFFPLPNGIHIVKDKFNQTVKIISF